MYPPECRARFRIDHHHIQCDDHAVDFHPTRIRLPPSYFDVQGRCVKMRLLQDLRCHLRTCGHTISGCEFHNAGFKDLEPFLRKLRARLLGEQISDRPRRQPLEIAIGFAKASGKAGTSRLMAV